MLTKLKRGDTAEGLSPSDIISSLLPEQLGPGTLPCPGWTDPQGWVSTKLRIATVTGERAQMRGKKSIRVTVTGRAVHHPLWLANIQALKWGAEVDVSGAKVTPGAEAMALHAAGEDEPATRRAITSGLRLHPKKCHLFQRETVFLGRVGPTLTLPRPATTVPGGVPMEHVTAISSWLWITLPSGQKCM